MRIERHGLTIGIERTGDTFFLSMKAVGKLTHEDYERITPMIDSALHTVTDPTVNAYLDATEFKGWALRAAWDDFKLGLRHGREFKKVAVVGHQDWLETASTVGSWFVGGTVKVFDNEADAMAWLHE